MKFLIPFLLLSISNTSIAATEGGGGGDVVVCYKNNEVKDMQLYDLWNTGSNREYRLNIKRDLDTPYMEQLERNAKKLSRVDIGLARYLLEKGQNFSPENINNDLVSLVPSIAKDNDGSHRVLPKEPGCDKVVIERIAQFNIDPLPFGSMFLITERLWEKAPNDTKAALIQHELIYLYAKKIFHEKTSRNTQYYNALISSTEFDELDLFDYFFIIFKNLKWLKKDNLHALNVEGKEFNFTRLESRNAKGELKALKILNGEVLQAAEYNFGKIKVSLATSVVKYELNSNRFIYAEGVSTEDFSGNIGIASYRSPKGKLLALRYADPNFENSLVIRPMHLSLRTPQAEIEFEKFSGAIVIDQATGEHYFDGILLKNNRSKTLQTKFGSLNFNTNSLVTFDKKGYITSGVLPAGDSQKITIGGKKYELAASNVPRRFKIPKDKTKDIELIVDFGRGRKTMKTLEGKVVVKGVMKVHIDQATLIPRKIFK